MKMTVSHGYLVQMANILAQPERIFGGSCSGSTAYKVYMNRKVADGYRDGFLKAFPPQDPRWNEYTAKHDGVYAEAKVTTVQELVALPQEKQDEISKRISEIDEEYRDVIEAENKAEAERQKLLAEEVEVDLYTVTPEEISIAGDDAWKIWDALYADGKGFIREAKED